MEEKRKMLINFIVMIAQFISFDKIIMHTPNDGVDTPIYPPETLRGSSLGLIVQIQAS
jgi:hypothetical protein